MDYCNLHNVIVIAREERRSSLWCYVNNIKVVFSVGEELETFHFFFSWLTTMNITRKKRENKSISFSLARAPLLPWILTLLSVGVLVKLSRSASPGEMLRLFLRRVDANVGGGSGCHCSSMLLFFATGCTLIKKPRSGVCSAFTPCSTLCTSILLLLPWSALLSKNKLILLTPSTPSRWIFVSFHSAELKCRFFSTSSCSNTAKARRPLRKFRKFVRRSRRISCLRLYCIDS